MTFNPLFIFVVNEIEHSLVVDIHNGCDLFDFFLTICKDLTIERFLGNFIAEDYVFTSRKLTGT